MSAANVIAKRTLSLIVAAALCLLLALGPSFSLGVQAAPVEAMTEQSSQAAEATGDLPEPAVETQAAPAEAVTEQPSQAAEATGDRPEPAVETQAAPAEAVTEQPSQAEEAVEERQESAAESQAAGGITEMNVVSIISTDEQGRNMLMPSFVFCDRENNEIYVLDRGKLTVYGENYFPVASIGIGRGLINASGVYVDREGNVYLAQGRYYNEPPRITVYNAAFFRIRDIDMSSIPDVETGQPRSLVIGDNGDIYVAFGDGLRGLLVLDKEGRFSHWLKPMDLIFDQQAIAEAQEGKDSKDEGAAQEQEEEEAEEKKEPDFDVSELVPELVPKGGEQQVSAEEPRGGMGPVQINDIQRDENGNLYLLSGETSKVYIYNRDEEFLYSFGDKGGSSGQLSQPRQLAVDSKKKAIYIVDYMRHAILIYDLSGRFMHEFGGKGNRPGWFQYPASIAANARGELVVADMFNRRVQVLDVQFEYRFPLFQVPFVYHRGETPQPQPQRTTSSRFYGPGFDAGGQASAGGERQKSRTLPEGDGSVI